MITAFTPWQSLTGGMLIGCAAVLLMLFIGRIAGITGILSGLLPPVLPSDWAWRIAFLAGMLASPLIAAGLLGQTIAVDVAASPSLLLIAGVAVGVGVVYGAGCPSGHGVCGLARGSTRSLAAVLTFMATAAATVFVVRHMIGT